MINLNSIYPEIFLAISILFSLIYGVFRNNSSKEVFIIIILSLVIILTFILNSPLENEKTFFNESYKIDYFSNLMKIIAIVATIFVLISSFSYLKSLKIFKIEYPILIASSLLGILVMISSMNLIVFYVGLELQSLALYVLASFNRDQIKSSEAGLKYFVLSALSSGLLLYGCSLIYGFTGSTDFITISQFLSNDSFGIKFAIVFILVGLSFKISAVPFHMWAPDVYEGSPTTVTLFFALIPKVAILAVLIKILYIPFFNLIDQWQVIIIFLSISSMTFGAIAAIGQKNLKRLMAFSSIGHMGYVLAGIATGTNQGIESSITYIIIYITMTLGFFVCLLMIKKNDLYYENIEDLSGLSKSHPILSICFLIMLFSLAGIPPLAGFFGKFYIFLAVIEQKMYFLAIVGLIATVISAFYYLRIIKVIYFDEEKEKYETEQHFGLKVSLAITTFITLLFFIFPGEISEIVSKINLI
tara:strand:+ start:7453 stop:8868 length:1416 start_codon:yes stop_codon:yes gene_type:complete